MFMRLGHPRHLTCLVVIGAAYTHPKAVSAQGVWRLAAGARVRVQQLDANAVPTGSGCATRVVRTLQDTIVVAARSSCAFGTYPATVWQARPALGGRLGQAFIGLGAGAVVGGVAGRLAAGDGCRISPCDDAGFAIGALIVTGVWVGALAGSFVGAAVPPIRRWIKVESGALVRVEIAR